METTLLNKILTELTEFRESTSKRFDGIEERISVVEEKIDAMDEDLARVKYSTLVMEQEHGQKLDLLLELYRPNYDQHITFDMRITNLKKVVDLHSLEIDFLKQAN